MRLRIQSIHRYFLILLLALITFAASLYLKQDFSVVELSLLKALPADLKLEGVEGDLPVTSQSILGQMRPTLVHFWGTWCAPCEAEFPDLIKFMQKFENSNVSFLLIASNDERPKVLKFLSSKKLPKNALVVLDPQGTAMAKFGTVKVPETYFFDKNGKIVKKFIGPQRWGDSSYEQFLNKNLGLI